MIIDMGIQSSKEKFLIYIAMFKGHVRFYSINEIFEVWKLTILPHVNERSNYNPFKSAKEIFE